MNNNILEINTNKNQNNEINNLVSNDLHNEGIPILSSLEITSSNSVEEFYRANYPEYKIIKFGNHTFIKMGRLITFYFDKKNNYIPKFSIGPHWYLTLLLLLIMLSLALLLYFTIFKRLSTIKNIIFVLFVLSVYYFALKAALVHPKVVMNKKKTNTEYGYCSFCKCFFNPYNRVEHCEDCGVCFEKMDHHCIWMGKCVAKNNTRAFYGMLIDTGIFYAYIIYCTIMMAKSKKSLL